MEYSLGGMDIVHKKNWYLAESPAFERFLNVTFSLIIFSHKFLLKNVRPQ